MIGRKFQLGNYLLRLEGKGFKFGEDIITFIYFGKQSTGSSDYLAAISIELTLKCQKRFDPSFYLSFSGKITSTKYYNQKTSLCTCKSVRIISGPRDLNLGSLLI